MKLNKLETHDRLEYFTKQSFDIGECCQDIINRRPFGNNPFYIFAHARTDDDGVTKRLIWQPRLTKPKSQSNSMLFKVYPGTDAVKIIWMIPAEEMWGQFDRGLMLENRIVHDSIQNFKTNRDLLDAKEIDDLSDAQIDDIYRQISQEAKTKQVFSEDLQFS